MTVSCLPELPLSALQQLVVSALDQSPDGFALYDGNDTLVYCNKAFSSLFGVSPELLVGFNHRDVGGQVSKQAHYMALNDRTLSEWLTTFEGGWRREPLRSYEVSSVDGGSYLVTEKVNGDGTVLCTCVDIGHRRSIEQRLERTDSLLRAILDHAPALISAKDLEGNIILANQRFNQLKPEWPTALIGANINEVFPPDVAKELWTNDLCALNAKSAIEAEEIVMQQDGRPHTYLSVKFPLHNNNGMPFAVCAISTDITARKRAEARVREREEQLLTLVENAPEAIVIYDMDAGRMSEANANAERLFGYSREELGRRAPDELSPPTQPDGSNSAEKAALYLAAALEGERPQFEWTHRNSKGEDIPCEIHLVRLPTANRQLIRGSITDISERKAIEKLLERQRQHLQFLAHHDALTHLPNRRLLHQRMDEAIAECQNQERCFAAMLIDLDRFKYINDSLGHPIGDQFLIAIAERLQALFDGRDTVSRLGGDEFVVILRSPGDFSQVANRARQLLTELAQPVVLADQELRTTLSIGICLFPQHGQDTETLLRNADVAMYKAKERGKNHFEFYDPCLDAKQHGMLQLETALRKALLTQQFQLAYQPQLRISDNRCFGAEALVRWVHPERGIIPPNDFIPLAEETGLINEMGQWILHTACAQFQQWQAQGLQLEKIAVNISARQFHQSGFIEQIQQIIQETGIPPRCLQLELTESVVMEDAAHSIEKLNLLQQIGVTLALDDFGTGYSSLSYLKQFPIQKLKIDKSFVRDIATDPNDAAIVRSVIALANSMNMEVIAEGVETGDQLTFLKDNGCKQMQGYLLSKPLFSEEFLRFYKAHRRYAEENL